MSNRTDLYFSTYKRHSKHKWQSCKHLANLYLWLYLNWIKLERGTAAEIQIQKQSKYLCTDSNPLYYLIVGSLEHLASGFRASGIWHLAMLVAPGILSEHRNEEYGKKQIQIWPNTLILYFNLAMTISNIIYCQRWTGFIISIRPTLSVNCQIVICSDIPCPARPIIINWARFEENIAVCNFND